MPYYQRSWNAVLGDQAPVNKRNIRKGPTSEIAEAQPYTTNKPTKVEDLKVIYTRNMLRKQMTEINNLKTADPLRGENNFLNYVIQKDQSIFKGNHSCIYIAYNHLYSDTHLACRIFQASSLINPENDPYLKILRHLGRKNCCIIGTMDIFYDEKRTLYLFQEYANKGNANDYMCNGNQIAEPQMCKWAQNIYRAMDYLGDVGIAHRSIQPKHIMLKANDAGDIQAKLSGFRSAIPYWNSEANDVQDQPCRPTSKKGFASFQAPEVFGKNGEYYNPIEADIWSYGATMFFLVARVYPYNTNSGNADEAINKTITGCKRLTDGAKRWLFSLTRSNTENRVDFDQIPFDPFFKSH